jgi:hypothetical protein
MIRALLLVLLCAATALAADDGFDAAPLWQLDPQPTHTLRRGLGPVLEFSDAPPRELDAVRPLWSRYADPTQPVVLHDVLWPLFMTRTTAELHQQLGLLGIYRRRLVPADGSGQRQTWLFPLYIQGRTREHQGYWALFPAGGTVRDFFGFDTIRFYAFPVYLTADKGATHSRHILWPFYARVQGPTVEKHRLFPFYGYARRPGQWDNRFILWPFILYGWTLDDAKPGRAFALFPLYGRIDYANPAAGRELHQRAYLWPFFTALRTESASRRNLPWPFIQLADNYPQPGDYRRYVWPFWGVDRNPQKEDTFYVWPLIRHRTERSLTGTIDRWYVLPFYWDFDYAPTPVAKAPANTFHQVWPLVSWEDGPNGARRVRSLALWPLRTWPAIDRNYAPFWTLYEYRAADQQRQHDLLWGLWQFRRAEEQVTRCSLFPLWHYRRAADDSARRFDLLTGLIGHERTPDGNRLRLLWFIRF